ncbi:MAG: hypothetical protein HQL52_16555 [Magnetococcales bacterium]|nr:hypothetical protein [Magnetococcales bacterium]
MVLLDRLSRFKKRLSIRAENDPLELDFSGPYFPQYLDQELVSSPALALGMARREMALVCNLIEEMMVDNFEGMIAWHPGIFQGVQAQGEGVEKIVTAIRDFLNKASNHPASDQDAYRLLTSVNTANELQLLGKALIGFAGKPRDPFAPSALEKVEEVVDTLLDLFRSTSACLVTNDTALAEAVLARPCPTLPTHLPQLEQIAEKIHFHCHCIARMVCHSKKTSSDN